MNFYVLIVGIPPEFRESHIFDVIYGNLTLEAALMRIKESGETHLNEKDFKELGLE